MFYLFILLFKYFCIIFIVVDFTLMHFDVFVLLVFADKFNAIINNTRMSLFENLSNRLFFMNH